jgi:hypothetical protein
LDSVLDIQESYVPEQEDLPYGSCIQALSLPGQTAPLQHKQTYHGYKVPTYLDIKFFEIRKAQSGSY